MLLIVVGILFIFLLQQNVVNAEEKTISLNAIALSMSDDNHFFSSLCQDFNNYAKENNLNINVNLIMLTHDNSTASADDYSLSLNQLYVKKRIKYELIFYFNFNMNGFENYFVDLNKWLNKNTINMYEPQVLLQTCTKKNKLVGFPLSNIFSVLYYNKNLLKKYNKKVPRTWDELIEIGEYIVNEEKKLNNTDLIAYNGLFNSIHTISFFEFINSYRQNKTSLYPDIRSKETREAFLKMKELNNKLNKDGIFDMPDDFSQDKLMNGKAVFLNYWMLTGEISTTSKILYGMTILPGRNEEVSSTSVYGFNIGINSLLETKYSESKDVSNAEKLDAAVKVVEYIVSRDLQKKYFLAGECIAAIPSLYEDEDICRKYDCEVFKRLQPVVNKIYETNGGMYYKNVYESKFRKYAIKYLFEDNVDLEETLRNIEDITKIYYIPLDRIEFSFGVVMVVVIAVLSLLMLLSLIFLFFENYQPFFKVLSADSWLILIMGIIMFLCSIIAHLGELSMSKCYLKIGLLEIGITLYLFVILYELIINLPLEIKLVEWIKNHKYIALFLLLLIDVLLIGLSHLDPYSIEIVIVEEGNNYQTCKMKYVFGRVITIMLTTEKFILVLAISFLLFVEWNMKRIFYEVRFILFAIYSDLLILSISLVINFINIKNYYLNFILQQCIIVLISLISYTCSYGFKLLLALLGKKDVKIAFIDKINKNFISGDESKPSKSVEESVTNYRIEKSCDESGLNYSVDDCNVVTESQQNRSFYSKILSYHYSSFSSVENV